LPYQNSDGIRRSASDVRQLIDDDAITLLAVDRLFGGPHYSDRIIGVGSKPYHRWGGYDICCRIEAFSSRGLRPAEDTRLNGNFGIAIIAQRQSSCRGRLVELQQYRLHAQLSRTGHVWASADTGCEYSQSRSNGRRWRAKSHDFRTVRCAKYLGPPPEVAELFID